ncbi:hypothetical protein GKE82_12335 [Conexibacter sp. W3-3-2]|uniref:Uncharacterized protein n=1 Tax=Paraconexibacter algicola TaxID=2133960 RepID=A0A2T4UHN4_9ACTN|nr:MULTISPECIES: hypothetical protein [Solirubrobacterales]MTD45057.1 hypothetical protein [Conexibacter sp. W3-3-2]PTL58754.1 hypothetical protein C7Y72_03370 [Paraconexibacter algicola]
MSPRDAFGRETDEGRPTDEVAPGATSSSAGPRTGVPRWLPWLVAVDLVIALVVVLLVVR